MAILILKAHQKLVSLFNVKKYPWMQKDSWRLTYPSNQQYSSTSQEHNLLSLQRHAALLRKEYSIQSCIYLNNITHWENKYGFYIDSVFFFQPVDKARLSFIEPHSYSDHRNIQIDRPLEEAHRDTAQ